MGLVHVCAWLSRFFLSFIRCNVCFLKIIFFFFYLLAKAFFLFLILLIWNFYSTYQRALLKSYRGIFSTTLFYFFKQFSKLLVIVRNSAASNFTELYSKTLREFICWLKNPSVWFFISNLRCWIHNFRTIDWKTRVLVRKRLHIKNSMIGATTQYQKNYKNLVFSRTRPISFSFLNFLTPFSIPLKESSLITVS